MKRGRTRTQTTKSTNWSSTSLPIAKAKRVHNRWNLLMEQNFWGQMNHHHAATNQQSEQWSISKLSRKRINTTKHICRGKHKFKQAGKNKEQSPGQWFTRQQRRHTLREWQTTIRTQNQNKPRGVVLAAVAAIVRVDAQWLTNQQVKVKTSGERTKDS
jgi:hypothetical protein